MRAKEGNEKKKGIKLAVCIQGRQAIGDALLPKGDAWLRADIALACVLLRVGTSKAL